MSLLDTLSEPAFRLWEHDVSWVELIGDVSGLATVWLTVRRHVLNWPVGLVNVVFFAVLFVQSRLYADAGLQGVFFVQGLYGWWRWTRQGTAVATGTTRVHRTTGRQWAAMGAAGVVLFGACIGFLRSTDDAAPVRDALVLALSLVATYGQARALVESWWVWIVTDLVSIPLYVSRGIYPTAAVYTVFLAMCVLGLLGWRRQLRAQVDEMALAA